MAKKRKTTTKKKAGKAHRRPRYTAGEWFMVLLGALLVVLIAGIVITSILGE
jgi:hypothetical protein